MDKNMIFFVIKFEDIIEKKVNAFVVFPWSICLRKRTRHGIADSASIE